MSTYSRGNNVLLELEGGTEIVTIAFEKHSGLEHDIIGFIEIERCFTTRSTSDSTQQISGFAK